MVCIEICDCYSIITNNDNICINVRTMCLRTWSDTLIITTIPNWWWAKFNLQNHALGDCFNSYRLINLHTENPGHCFLYASSSRSGRRKVFLISIWHSSHWNIVSNIRKTEIDGILVTKENFSLTLYTYMQSFLNWALSLTIVPFFLGCFNNKLIYLNFSFMF